MAGPPYLTDDPVPTDTGHWEIYAFAPAKDAARPSTPMRIDLNYGPMKGVQLTATLPLSFSHVPAMAGRGTGDVELGVKYRFFHDEKRGLSAAIFPRVILPTAAMAPDEKTRLLLPLWLARTLPGGPACSAAAAIRLIPGVGNRDFWQAGLAVTQESLRGCRWAPNLPAGGRRGWWDLQTRAGLGGIMKLAAHYALLISGGPTWADRRTGYHAYAALGLNF